MLFSHVDVRRTFDASALREADFLLEQGLVERPDVRREGALITSVVRQAAGQPFRVYVRTIACGGKLPEIEGECNCATRRNCSHVAAVLLQSLSEEPETPGPGKGARALPRLRERGWKVEQVQGFRLRLAETEHWFGDLEPLGESDWFGLQLGVQVDGVRVNLLPALVECLESLPSGRRAVSESAKLEMLMDLLPGLIEDGRRILLFSQFTSMLALIEREIETVGIPYVKLTGRTGDRSLAVDRFQAGATSLFRISLKAGGLGLNLTAADTVIHYDLWWNPAVERQATDRAHRIGQNKPVFIYKLISEGTVEEKMLALQARKQRLVDSVFTSKAASAGLWSAEDLELLFKPL